MAIWLLAIETAFASLAGFSFWLSLFGRINRRAIYLALGLILWLSAAGASCMLTAASFVIRSRGATASYFPQALTLAVVVTIGGLWFLVCGAVRRDGRLRAAQWPLGRGFIIWIAFGALNWLIRYRLDVNARKFAAETRSQVAHDYAELTGPMPADADNSRDLYEAAFKQIAAVTKEFDREQEDKHWASIAAAATQPATPPAIEPAGAEANDVVLKSDLLLYKEEADRPETADLLARLAPAMELMKRGADRASCRFGQAEEVPDMMKLMASGKSHLNEFQTAASAFQVRAVLMGHRREIPAAMQDIRRIGKLARHVDQTEPCYMSSLMRVGFEAKACDALMEVLPFVTDPWALADDVIPDEVTIADGCDRGLQGETAELLGTELRFAGGHIESTQDTPQSGKIGTFYGILWLRPDVETTRSYINSFRNHSFEDVRYRPRDHVTGGGPVVQVLMPAISLAPRTYLRLINTARQARIAMGLTHYRLQHGSYPTSLDELVPLWLPAIPADPFDGKPMRYRLDDGDALIYSVGEGRTGRRGQVDSLSEWGVRLRKAASRNPKQP